ncbi:MAG: anthranilate phosphoribosyltransferase [Calditrichaeota bacterium]|nr:anthranilate phosphoribosyltransferase [Calditrichota bacterium]
MIASTLEKLARGQDLSREEAAAVLEQVVQNAIPPAAAGALLMGLRTKGEHPREITGFADTMEKHMVRVTLNDPDAIDVCGTGGDGKHTFNISTAAAFVIAAGGVTVAKHGNRSVSSKAGSADVLEALGIRIDLTPEQAVRCANEMGITFFFAPLYHPAMKHIAPHRKHLGIRTVFNILGPLLNPARVRRQLIGAFDRETAQRLAEVLATRGVHRAVTVHSQDGYDEASPFASNHLFLIQPNNGGIQSLEYRAPIDGRSFQPEELQGHSARENAEKIQGVLSGKIRGAAREMVVLNAALGFFVAEKVQKIEDGLELARECIDSGAAMKTLEAFREFTQNCKGES